MTFPLIVLCVLSVLGGLLGLPHVFHVPHLLAEYLAPVTDASKPFLHGAHHLSAGLEIGLMTFAGLAAMGVIWVAYRQYVQKKKFPAAESELSGWQKWAFHKFYVDEFYHRFFVFPAFKLSGWFSRWVDRRIVDRSVNSTGDIMHWSGKTLRLLQSGNTGFYLFAMVSGVIVLMILRLLVA
jgi:NADH-quinone oxidoreductase subunit L